MRPVSAAFAERLRRAVYCSIGEPPGSAKAYEKMTDSKLAGAALFLRVFLVRFAKRFPQQHGFVHPVVDARDARASHRNARRGVPELVVSSATKSTPAAIVVRMTNDGVRRWCARPTALVDRREPLLRVLRHAASRELSGHPSIFIIDLQALTFGIYTSSNIKAIAGQLIAAMFHPEPFSAFVVAHAPSAIQFVWGVAKLFLTESARQKFVITSGSASAHFHKKLGVPLDEIPEAVGGTCKRNTLLTAADLLRIRAQDDAVAAYVDAHGADIAAHAPGTVHAFSKLPRHLAGSELFPRGAERAGDAHGYRGVLGPVPGDERGHGRPRAGPDAAGAVRRRARERGKGGGAARAERHPGKNQDPTARDLRVKISSLAEKLEKAAWFPPRTRRRARRRWRSCGT